MGQSRFSFATVKLLHDKIRNTQFQIFSLNNNLQHTKHKGAIIWKFPHTFIKQNWNSQNWKLTWKFTKLAKEQGTLLNLLLSLLSLFSIVHCGVDGDWANGYSFALGCWGDG